jgi:hypothetical protein
MLGLIVPEMRVGLPNFEDALSDPSPDPLLDGVSLKGRQVGPIQEYLRDELFDMRVQILVVCFDFPELLGYGIAHYKFQL